jgi:hypothetical protein
MSVFIVTQWQSAVGVGWMWGMGAFFVLIVDVLMAVVIVKGHSVRTLTVRVSNSIAITEDGERVFSKESSTSA